MKLLPQFTPSFPGSPVSWRQEIGDTITSWFQDFGYVEWQIMPEFDEDYRLNFKFKQQSVTPNIWKGEDTNGNNLLVFDPHSEEDFMQAMDSLNYLKEHNKLDSCKLGIDREILRRRMSGNNNMLWFNEE